MSIKLMSAIFETEMIDLPYPKDGEERKAKATTAKMVLLALADHANDYGESAYPGYTRLETKTCLSRQGIADTLEALKYNGLLTVAEAPSRLGTNDYTINIRCFPAMAKEASELPELVKPLDQASQATLLAVVKPLDHNHHVITNEPSIGAIAPDDMPIDWKIGHNIDITANDLDQLKLDAQRARTIADLIDMQCPGGGALALEFMATRGIVFPASKVKGQRKAARELLEQGVRPEHVGEAVYALLAKNMTVVDLFSITKTAVSLAHPPVEQGYNPQELAVT